MAEEVKILKPKPIVSYWKSGDPCHKIINWKDKLTDINIINTKTLSDEFISVCLLNKHRIFLHINITGLGQTLFEPNIPRVKETFFKLKKLVDSGFPQKQILVVVNPIIPNENGLKALKLLLILFTEFKALRLRFIRFSVLQYSQTDDNKFVIGNYNILKRSAIKGVMPYLGKQQSFFKDYFKLIDDYAPIISVDKGDEALIGIRELMAFGLKNEWINPDGVREKIINYEKGNKYKPIVELLSESRAIRCKNRCLLCPHLY